MVMQYEVVFVDQTESNNTHGGFMGVQSKDDGAGNLFEWWLNENPSTTDRTLVVRRTDVNTNQTEDVSVTAPDGMKIDDIGAAAASLQAGHTLADLAIPFDCHKEFVAGHRTTRRYRVVLHDVYVPRTNMSVQEDGPGTDFGTGDNSTVDFTLEQLMSRLTPLLNAIPVTTANEIDTRMGPSNLRQDFEDKMKDAFLEMIDASNHENKAEMYRWFMANFVRDRAYEADVSFGH